MPYDPSSFYNPMYLRRDLSGDAETVTSTESNGTETKNVTKRNAVDDNEFDRTKYHSELNNHQDISAGELYNSIETLLVE